LILEEKDRITTPRGKTKIKILEKKLQIYEINKNSEYLLKNIYLDINASFDKEDIEIFFDLEQISNYGVSYEDYKSQINNFQKELDEKLEE
jgi:hypothetical protein